MLYYYWYYLLLQTNGRSCLCMWLPTATSSELCLWGSVVSSSRLQLESGRSFLFQRRWEREKKRCTCREFNLIYVCTCVLVYNFVCTCRVCTLLSTPSSSHRLFATSSSPGLTFTCLLPWWQHSGPRRWGREGVRRSRMKRYFCV